ncbi:MAG: UDP-N-acetylmuramate dehydrogenase [Acidimicrobiia bacterium]|nr:UDP-N-acetylmuramate dehydrogenase [Acidimicrobiia bacterium]
MSAFGGALRRAFGTARVWEQRPLAPLTTFRVGGPAEYLVETRSSDEIVTAHALARQHDVPVTMLGGGSNVLVADAGIRGLVIRPRGGLIQAVDESYVRADAAATINGLGRWTILHGLGGLERWAGTPGTVGGAIYGNAHFGGRLISDHVANVCLIDRDGHPIDVPAAGMGFGYDQSRLQGSGEVLLWATFQVSREEPEVLRAAARESLAYRKRTQPLDTPSAGCVFRNPEPGRDRVPEGIRWSAGALVDRAGLKGVGIGGARVSTVHGNFIVNEGGATAADIHALIERCRVEVQRQFGVELREEVVFLGESNYVHTAH